MRGNVHLVDELFESRLDFTLNRDTFQGRAVVFTVILLGLDK